MKYYIYENEILKEVSADEYEKWDSSAFILEPFYVSVKDVVYTVETHYHGSIDDYEEILPFVMVWFKDELVLRKNLKGIKQEYRKDEIEYFATFDEMKKRYDDFRADLLEKSIQK